MNDKELDPKRRWRSSLLSSIVIGLLVATLAICSMFVIPFLTVTRKVEADVLVVEAWIPRYQFRSAAEEFLQGRYSWLIVSGQQRNSPEDKSAAEEIARIARHLEELGVPRAALITSVAPYTQWRRTSNMGKTVRQKIRGMGLKSKGLNVLTEGTHARETWTAFRHSFGNELPVGIISIPKTNRPGPFWWTNPGHLIWVTKDILGWLKEVIFPLRS